MNDDAKLLLRYAQERSEAAFAELVRRHVDLVYSAALRRCAGNTHRAEDVVQQVFSSLAQGAEKLAHHPTLGAWLYTATRNAATNLWIAEKRRAQREQDALMSGLLPAEESAPDWTTVRPVLDDAMDELGETDRTAVLMRFFERRSYAEIGAALNISENTARMRTDRALEKLRLLLQKRGVSSAATALGLVLVRQAVVAAPVGIAAAVTANILGLPSSSVIPGGSLIGHGAKKLFTILGGIVLVTAVVLFLVSTRRAPANTEGIAAAVPAADPWSKGEQAPPQTAPAQAAGPLAPSKAGNSQQELQASTPVPSTNLTAEQILEKMAATYAALSSYQDTGEVLEEGIRASSKAHTTFQTYFRRPGHFRFDWTASQIFRSAPVYTRSAMIWSEGGQAYCYTEYDPKNIRESSLSTAVAVYIGSSKGSSYHVPRLLMAQALQHYFSPAGLSEPKLVGEAEMEGTRCYQIKGNHPNGNRYELWVGKKDFLLRKIKTVTPLSFLTTTERLPGDDGSALEEIHREIQTNGNIPDEIFRVKPPGP